MRVALLFAALAVALTWPMAVRLSTHVPGNAPDDNLVFLWNFWWMRQSLASGLSGFFHTPYLFHPGGVDLVLHTHAAVDAGIGATLFGRAALPAALNLTLLLTCALNAFSAYLLAYRVSRHRAASVLAGAFFAASPALAGHLSGRFSSYSAWPLVCLALAVIEALDGRRRLWAAGAGLMLALAAYNDYYYFIYACAFIVCVLACRWLTPGVRMAPVRAAATRVDYALLVVALLAAGAAAAVTVTGGWVLTIGPMRVSLTRGANLRALATLAAFLWLWRRRRPLPTMKMEAGRIAPDLRQLGVAFAVCAVLMAPLVQAAVAVMRSGGYVTQAYVWRSAPAGVDLGTLVLGNPFSGLWGGLVAKVYNALGIWMLDGPFWFGVVPLVLLLTWTAWRTHLHARLWLIVAGFFALWAIGPYLTLFGVNTGLPMPHTLVRFVPIASNARIPGHAAVFVALGVALLLAMAVASSRAFQSPWRTGALAAAVLVDFWSPVPMFRLESPAIYQQLAAMPDGAVLDIPLGIRDGFGEEGRIDTSVLYYQTLHRKPIVGGYLGRLPPPVKARYHDAPVLDALLKLSAGAPGAPAVTGAEARDFLRACGVRYVVVETRLATPGVTDFVASMGLRQMGGDQFRKMFVIE